MNCMLKSLGLLLSKALLTMTADVDAVWMSAPHWSSACVQPRLLVVHLLQVVQLALLSRAEDRHAIIAHWRPLGSNGRPLPDDGIERSYCAVFDGHNGSRSAEV
jgi:hypothetical protein